ncbi:glycosyltransferase [Pseudonocardia benzenivorans]|uniref:Glycosyl transferase family 2 n=2 Tax=Pseudonocardia TaxID=1847 RepID=F4CKD4_PSEUX|nr:glycosyltransferase family 2 protein [Pseudonocardia dioxanivorans]AEA22481.1 glycosyl transferase family 2 [Pseudonocardia dioxanivorans CB1190]GJF02272.1 glycosyl transferase [Pseudonocardia sp. D17]
MTPLPPGSVVAVVVTRHRAAMLVDSLAAMAKQTHPIAHLVVVDNGPDESAREVVEGCGLPATWIPSWRNLGGAGGFALGILHALALGADWVWLGDDDGLAADETVLATLLDLADRRGLAAVSPTVADRNDPDRLAFPVRRGLTWHATRSGLLAEESADAELLPGIAALFNGALFRAATLERVGVPDLRLFVRGDEVDVHRRLVRSGLPFGTALQAAYLHPAAVGEDKPMLRGRLHARDPDDPVKRFYTYRNRGYLIAQPGMRRVGVLDVPRYAWYFLVTKRSPAQFREWLRLVRAGAAERFDRP